MTAKLMHSFERSDDFREYRANNGNIDAKRITIERISFTEIAVKTNNRI